MTCHRSSHPPEASDEGASVVRFVKEEHRQTTAAVA
jgi:hypothetical protein